MDDQDTRRLRFDTEPRELVRLLRKHSKAKAGPFSWSIPSGEGEIGIYLDVRKSGRDGFEARVNTIRYRKPGGSFFADEGIHALTLHGTRIRDGETLVLVRSQEPRVARTIFVHFCREMDRLREELAIPVPSMEQVRSERIEDDEPPPKAEPIPAKEAGDEGSAPVDQDSGLDALDRKIIEVVEKLWRAGVRATDDVVALRLPPNPKTELPRSRVTVNRRRCRLRDRGYKV